MLHLPLAGIGELDEAERRHEDEEDDGLGLRHALGRGVGAVERIIDVQRQHLGRLDVRGVKVSGATVHFVDEDMDTGPIILQKAVYVQDGDTPKALQQRIMEEAEWQILPQAIDLIAQGRVVIEGRTTRILPGADA
ncbi:MAG: hypothetical protein IJI13_05760 [Oscillospiraceae bacterium]|nr:hypothetical protein [Oscillospiraceae bacterium]